MSSEVGRRRAYGVMAAALYLNHCEVHLYLYGPELIALTYVGLVVNRKGRLRVIGSKRRKGKKSGTNT